MLPRSALNTQYGTRQEDAALLLYEAQVSPPLRHTKSREPRRRGLGMRGWATAAGAFYWVGSSDPFSTQEDGQVILRGVCESVAAAAAAAVVCVRGGKGVAVVSAASAVAAQQQRLSRWSPKRRLPGADGL